MLAGTLKSSCVHQNVLAEPLISSVSSVPPFALLSLISVLVHGCVLPHRVFI
jgi:hypothetical protein